MCNCSTGGCSCTGNSSTLPIGPTGDTGATGPSGTNGTNGTNGIFGGFSDSFTFSTSTATGPSTGQLRFNSATPTSVTAIYVSDIDAGSQSAEAFLDSFINGGAYGYVRVFKTTDSTKFWYGKVTSVTDNGADHTINVDFLGWNANGSAPFVNSDPVVISFSPAGTNATEATLTIASASILTLNATPITIVAAPGAGKYIEVISASATMTYVSAAYATNTTLQLINTGATIAQLQNTSILISSATKNTKFTDVTPPSAAQTQMITNTALQVKVATGDPTGGDSAIRVKVLYRIVTI